MISYRLPTISHSSGHETAPWRPRPGRRLRSAGLAHRDPSAINGQDDRPGRHLPRPVRQARVERAVVEAEEIREGRARAGPAEMLVTTRAATAMVTKLIAVDDGLPAGVSAATTSWAGRSHSRDSRFSWTCSFESCRVPVGTRSGDRPEASGRCALHGVVQCAAAVQHPRHEQRGHTGGLPARRTGCLRFPDAYVAAGALSAEGACGCVDAAADRCR